MLTGPTSENKVPRVRQFYRSIKVGFYSAMKMVNGCLVTIKIGKFHEAEGSSRTNQRRARSR